jgi:hypothetical protein
MRCAVCNSDYDDSYNACPRCVGNAKAIIKTQRDLAQWAMSALAGAFLAWSGLFHPVIAFVGGVAALVGLVMTFISADKWEKAKKASQIA